MSVIPETNYPARVAELEMENVRLRAGLEFYSGVAGRLVDLVSFGFPRLSGWTTFSLGTLPNTTVTLEQWKRDVLAALVPKDEPTERRS